MSDYIEREALLAHLFCKQDEQMDIAKEIAEFPTADVVPVVRCKDCIHSISYVDKSGATAYVVCNLDEDSDEIELRTPMDYCSCGDREEANT